jgi:hypothetical protein
MTLCKASLYAHNHHFGTCLRWSYNDGAGDHNGGCARALSPTVGHAPTAVPAVHAQALWAFGDADLT